MHYLQDYSIDPTEKLWIFSYRSDAAHDEREGLRVEVNEEAVEEALRTKCYPHEFKGVALQTKRGKTAEEISFASSFLTALAFKMLVKPDMPEDLNSKYSRALTVHIVLLLLPWLFMLVFASGAAYLLISSILSVILHYADFNYHRWKTDYEWFAAG